MVQRRVRGWKSRPTPPADGQDLLLSSSMFTGCAFRGHYVTNARNLSILVSMAMPHSSTTFLIYTRTFVQNRGKPRTDAELHAYVDGKKSMNVSILLSTQRRG